MADALASGASVRKDVGVQVPPRAPQNYTEDKWRKVALVWVYIIQTFNTRKS